MSIEQSIRRDSQTVLSSRVRTKSLFWFNIRQAKAFGSNELGQGRGQHPPLLPGISGCRPNGSNISTAAFDVFGTEELDNADVNIVRWNRKSEIQDGGRKTQKHVVRLLHY